MLQHFHRFVLRDTSSLRDIMAGRWPPLSEVRRRLFIAEWRGAPNIPDHERKNLREHNLGDTKTYRDLLLNTLTALSQQFIEVRGGQPLVIPSRFAEWQCLLTWIAPLPVLATAIWRQFPPRSWDQDTIETFGDEVLRRALNHSSLPTTRDPLVEQMIAHQRTHDLHIHLNGTTEVDLVWLDVLLQRRAFMFHLRNQANKESVLEQYNQIEEGLNYDKIGARLRTARRIRYILTQRFQKTLNFSMPLEDLVTDNPLFLDDQLTLDYKFDLGRHPLRSVYALKADTDDLVYEAIWLIRCLQHIDENLDEGAAKLLYTYLLILNATFQPLCVQQENQFGFDQFQKITLNGAREATEADYARRFKQIAYSEDGDVAVVEGRFAPKDDVRKMAHLLLHILRGFSAYHGLARGDYDPIRDRDFPRNDKALDLRLVAHFIKTDELAGNLVGRSCRFEMLRHKVARQLRVLNVLRQNYAGIAHFLTGIDAAANELHTPPEVFAPVYRAARRAGFVHFTYHVGEDFEHLTSGIRATYEAITFLNLSVGDRIGHGTALGIDPELWLRCSQTQIAKRCGDWLDDLVFAYRHLDGGSRYPELHAKLEMEIARLSQMIYGTALSPVLLDQAWQLRYLDPLIALDPAFDPLSLLDRLEREEEWKPVENKKKSEAAFNLFRQYHDPKIIRKSQSVELIDTNLFSADALVELQVSVIRELNTRGVAIECPLTSNIRISRYSHYKEHHLFRWLGLRRVGEPKPLVCLASDDPGIFATTMRNEFIHVHRILRDEFGLQEHEAMEKLMALNRYGAALVFID